MSPHQEIAERVIGNIVQASAVAVSPDGRQVAFVATRVDLAANKYVSQIWLVPADGSAPPRVLTNGARDDNPAWSPDGRALAFTAKRSEQEGESTLHVIPVDVAGETRALATMKGGVKTPSWSPDGRWIAFTSRTQDERYAATDESWQAPRKIERFFSTSNGEGWIFDRPRHIYVVAADGTSTAPRNLTPGPFEHEDIGWLPDSSGVVTCAGRHDSWDLDFAVDVYHVTLDGRITALTAQTGVYSTPSVSPDGSTVALIGRDDPGEYPQNLKVGVLPIGGGRPVWLSQALDRTFQPTAGSRAPVWIDSTTLLSSAEDRGQAHLYQVHLDGSAPTAVTAGARSVKAFDARAGVTAFCASSVDAVSDVFVAALDTSASGVSAHPAARLTSFAERYRSAATPLTWERFAVPCADGSDEIDAWIMRPAGFDPTKHYPLLFNVHGGPFAQYGEMFFDEAQLQAAAGFVVLMSNPRGSSGRATSWGQSIMGPKHPTAPGTGWGTVDVDDLLTVLDAALSSYPFADAHRLGMLGGSYGGYIATLLAAQHGGRFQAICSERAVNNLVTEEFTSDISTIFRIEHGPSHIDDPAEYERMSPIRFVRDIDVPVLIIHSENDLRCPINQAEELFVAMRLLGKDVTFYRFPGESHELSRTGSPIHRRQRAEIILDFFATKLNP
jgi:dipeptidyl aminopeptidase/acylaminoacyl peptidase